MKPRTQPLFAVAVKNGPLFQAQLITYNAKGIATIVPLSGWTTMAEAYEIKATAKARS